MRFHRNALTLENARRYSVAVVETAATLDWRLGMFVADNRRSAVFLRPYTLSLLWSGLGEGALAHAGSHGRRYANLALCPATPIGVDGRDRQTVRGSRTMHQLNHAYTGQNPSLIQSIIRDALRDAATAPTVFDALDVTGDALRRLAEIARAELRHA